MLCAPSGTNRKYIYINVLSLGEGIVQWLKRRARAGRPGFDSRQGKKCSPLRRVQTASGAHSASYPIGTGANVPGSKTERA
jgi:hypothetical protein